MDCCVGDGLDEWNGIDEDNCEQRGIENIFHRSCGWRELCRPGGMRLVWHSQMR